MLKNTAGAEIHFARAQQRLTQGQLSEKAGVSIPTILAIEKGQTLSPRLSSVIAIAEALGLDARDLVDMQQVAS